MSLKVHQVYHTFDGYNELLTNSSWALAEPEAFLITRRKNCRIDFEMY